MKYGIDVAQWQGNIDWSKVKKDFAILKVTKKDNTIEPKFLANYKGATANGIPVGVYRYVYAKNTTQAKAEADAIVKALLGLQITCGVWLDMEDSSIKKLGKNTLTNIINVMANTIKASGLNVGIYCNRDWFLNVLDGANLSKIYPFWIARYPLRDTGTFNPNSTISPKAYAKAWQYSQKGKVNGIVGDVDMDVMFDDALIGALPTSSVPSVYYPQYTGTSVSLVSALASIGEKDTSKAHRTKIAKANGISGYAGSATQNTNMLNLLKQGKLKRI